MAERYFAKFPTIEYANTKCVNITKRPVIADSIDKNPTLFHKYTLKTSSRADVIAENYYEDPFYEWLIFLNNKIVDPYYGWYLNDYDFNNFIELKYGSTANAQERIIHYQLNWPTDDKEISASFYNNSLPDALKKYYTPNFGQSNKIISYKRKQDDFTVSTNRIVTLDIVITSGNGFSVGEIIDIENPLMSSVVGGGEVVFANSSILKIKHVSGNTSVSYTPASFNSNTGVNNSTDYITTSANHGFSNGDLVQYLVSTGNSAIGGLTSGALYYVRYANSTTGFALSETLTGANVNITATSVSETGHTINLLSKVVGETTNTIASFTRSTITYKALSDEEAVYWSPVYYYEYELEQNEKNKNIRLLHSNYALQTSEELRTTMKE